MFGLIMIIIFATGGLISFILRLTTKSTKNSGYRQTSKEDMLTQVKMKKKLFTSIGFSFLYFCLLTLILSCGVIIKPGNIGIKQTFGKYSEEVYYPGLHLKNPVSRIINVSTRLDSYTMSKTSLEGNEEGDDSIVTRSKDGIKLNIDTTLLYRINPEKVIYLLSEQGNTYESKIIRNITKSNIVENASPYLFEEITTSKREEFSQVAKEGITNEKIVKDYFFVEDLLIRNIDFPLDVEEAINRKVAEGQKAETTKIMNLIEDKKAIVRELEARGIAGAQEIIQENMTPEYIQWKYIQEIKSIAEDNNQNNTFIIYPLTEDFSPIINVK
jgi:prohibitin 1